MMKTIYLDSDYQCHMADDGTRHAVETDVFDGKCDAYIEGCRFIPAQMRWVRADGEVFEGEMVSRWKDDAELDDAQRSFEQKMIAAYEALINQLYEEVL